MDAWMMDGMFLIHITTVLQSDAAAGLQDACMALVDDYSQVTHTRTRARTTFSELQYIEFCVCLPLPVAQ